MLLTSMVFEELIEELYTLHGERPPQFSIFSHGHSGCAATCQITREGGAIIDLCIVVFGPIALVSLHSRSRRVCLCSRLPCGS